ncbi:MAG: signal peptidase I [Ruminococcus sp.]|nr:signal peptidase I [Candidatus Apopatosoma intestinale]
MSEKKKKTWKIVGNVILWAFLVLALIMTIWAFSIQASSNGMPSVGGKCFLTVKSPSMKGKDGFDKGDLIISRIVDEEEKQHLQVGDVITFYTDLTPNDGVDNKELNSHRIVEVAADEYGDAVYYTMGDANGIRDDKPVHWLDIEAVWTGRKIVGVGSLISFLQSKAGFFFCIVLPLLCFFIYEIVVLIMTINKARNKGKREISKEEEELIKQRAIEEYIRRQAEIERRANDGNSKT